MIKTSFDQLASEIDDVRQRILRTSAALQGYFVDKGEIIELMTIATLAQEPLLLIGRPGTAKSDLVVRFCEALGLRGADYFEYMLTKFTEPSEIVGPIDITLLKEGKYIRRVEGKLPEARIVFLDEIFKSNSAILNTLLTIINERKYYQDGKPVPVQMRMLFAATNDIPEFTELDALKDRFVLKVESRSVKDDYFDELIDAGLRGEIHRAFKQKLCSMKKPSRMVTFRLISRMETSSPRESALKRACRKSSLKSIYPISIFGLSMIHFYMRSSQRLVLTMRRTESRPILASAKSASWIFRAMILLT